MSVRGILKVPTITSPMEIIFFCLYPAAPVKFNPCGHHLLNMNFIFD